MANATVPDIFPRLLPSDSSLKSYSGFIEILGHEFELGLDARNIDQLANAQLYCDERLKRVLKGHEAVVQKRLAQSSTIAAFFIELKVLLERLLTSKVVDSMPSVQMYARILDDFAQIGWHRVEWVSEDLTKAKLVFVDRVNRKHALNLSFPHDFPKSEPKFSTLLPGRFEPLTSASSWIAGGSSLAAIFSQFEKVALRYQDFFNVMDEIDARTCVLEPETPTTADTFRRIAVVRHVTLHIEIQPSQPRIVPTCRFLGADSAIKPLKDRFNASVFQWDSSGSVVDNLERIFQVDLAARRGAPSEELRDACTICYDYEVEGEVPDRICDNPKCSKAYHSSCLQSWLESRPNKKVLFDSITGPCVICTHPISVRIKR